MDTVGGVVASGKRRYAGCPLGGAKLIRHDFRSMLLEGSISAATASFFFLDLESARLQTHCDNCWYSRNKVSALRAER